MVASAPVGPNPTVVVCAPSVLSAGNSGGVAQERPAACCSALLMSADSGRGAPLTRARALTEPETRPRRSHPLADDRAQRRATRGGSAPGRGERQGRGLPGGRVRLAHPGPWIALRAAFAARRAGGPRVTLVALRAAGAPGDLTADDREDALDEVISVVRHGRKHRAQGRGAVSWGGWGGRSGEGAGSPGRWAGDGIS